MVSGRNFSRLEAAKYFTLEFSGVVLVYKDRTVVL